MQEKKPNKTTRRRFLFYCCASLGVLTTALALLRLSSKPLPSPKSIVSWKTLQREPTGKLDQSSLRVLLSAQEALTGVKNHAHYEAYFHWHAKHKKGYRGLYREFARYLYEEALKVHHKSFLDCSSSEQRGMLETIMASRPFSGKKQSIHPLFREFDRYVIREIFRVYSRTYAWQAMGYEAYPGLPLGITLYTLAPPSLSQSTKE